MPFDEDNTVIDVPRVPAWAIKIDDLPESNGDGRYFVGIVENANTGTLCWNYCEKVLTTIFNYSLDQANAKCHALNDSGMEMLAEYETEREADAAAISATVLYRENHSCPFNHKTSYPFVYGKLESI